MTTPESIVDPGCVLRTYQDDVQNIMHNHAPIDYVCPLCLAAAGVENDNTLVRKSDIVFKDELITAFISSFFIGNNPGHVVIIPNKHFENIYELPEEYATRIMQIAKRVAIALKETYKCDGTTLTQHNEPAGGQHAFHFHIHVFPRYTNDHLYENIMNKRETTSEDRLPYAEKLRKYVANNLQ